MAVREYIGARYVPMFADPISWDNTKTYEPLTVVMYQGNSYTSRQYVPTGIAIDNDDYWALTGNYNAQIEQYRGEVQSLSNEVVLIDGRVDTLSDTCSGLDLRLDAIEADDWVTSDRIADGAVTSDKFNDGSVTTDKIGNAAVTAQKLASNSVTSGKISDGAVTAGKIGSSAVTTVKIADEAITTAKIADNAITKEKIANEDIFLIFGDSWCNFIDHPNWSISVADVLECGTIINYGFGGATFISNSSNLVSQQISQAISELTSAQKANVKYVMIMAGVNDHNPYQPSGFNSAVEECLIMCKNAFTNAVVQWFPTSCAPSYTSDGKWLYCAASFWNFISERGNGSDNNDEDNHYAFPSCGTAFYFNQRSNAEAFFDGSKLHLNDYGRRAIANAILEGYGKLAFPYYRDMAVELSSNRGHLIIKCTPTSVRLHGYVENLSGQPDYELDATTSERIILGMVGEQSAHVASGSMPLNTLYPVFPANGGADGYAGFWIISPYYLVSFDTSSGFSGSTRYIAG